MPESEGSVLDQSQSGNESFSNDSVGATAQECDCDPDMAADINIDDPPAMEADAAPDEEPLMEFDFEFEDVPLLEVTIEEDEGAELETSATIDD